MPLRPPSLVVRLMLAYENVCGRKSAHAGAGSSAPSKMAPVTGVDVLLQETHWYRCMPDRPNPFFLRSPPQKGRSLRGRPLKKAASPSKGRRRKAYMLPWLAATIGCAGVESVSGISSQGVAEAARLPLGFPLMVWKSSLP